MVLIDVNERCRGTKTNERRLVPKGKRPSAGGRPVKRGPLGTEIAL